MAPRRRYRDDCFVKLQASHEGSSFDAAGPNVLVSSEASVVNSNKLIVSGPVGSLDGF